MNPGCSCTSAMNFPLSPMYRMLFVGSFVTSASGAPTIRWFGAIPPSYQNIFTPGRSGRSGNSYLMTDQFGALSFVLPSLNASTLIGSRRSRAQYGPSIKWQAMSPSAPVPKSHHPRHLNGWYAGLYDRCGAEPQVPLDVIGLGRRIGRRRRDALRPDRAVRPAVHFADRAEHPALGPLDLADVTLAGVPVVAHLRRDLVLPRRFRELARLGD